MKGRAIRPGDAIIFAPGNRPIRFARIGAERFTHPTGGTYRIGYDLAGREFALYDDHSHGLADQIGLEVSAMTGTSTIDMAALTFDLPAILENVDPTQPPAYTDPRGDTMQALAAEVLDAWYGPSREWDTDAIPAEVVDAMADALAEHYTS